VFSLGLSRTFFLGSLAFHRTLLQALHWAHNLSSLQQGQANLYDPIYYISEEKQHANTEKVNIIIITT
jgi:hypothetical protein